MMYFFYELWEKNKDIYPFFSFLRLFKYITFRTSYAALTSLIFSFVFGPYAINQLKKFKLKQTIRKDGPQSHLAKEGTPTMGGLIIIFSILISIILWGNFKNPYIWLLLGILLGSGLLGFIDDYTKISLHNPKGVSGNFKIVWLTVMGLLFSFALLIILPTHLHNSTTVLFKKNYLLHMPLVVYTLFLLFVFVGTTNSVNLTDGMDGLAIGITTFVTIALAIVAYLVGHYKFSQYLGITYIPGASEVTVFIGAIFGACLGFLWFNAAPAQIFMGDTGSLCLGALIGSIAIILKQELLLIILGGIYMAEAISVMLQVGYFKFTKKYFNNPKRLFLMAPLHHHFEQKGIPESKLVVRFWIIAIILMLLGLSTLKLR